MEILSNFVTPPNYVVIVMIAARFLGWNMVIVGNKFVVLCTHLPSKVMLVITVKWSIAGFKILSRIASPQNVENCTSFTIRTGKAIELAQSIKYKCAPADNTLLRARYCLIYTEIDFNILIDTVVQYIEVNVKTKCTDVSRVGRTWFATFSNTSKLIIQICLEIILVECKKYFATVPTGSSKLTKYDGKVEICGTSVPDLIYRTATASQNVIQTGEGSDQTNPKFHINTRSIVSIKISKHVSETESAATYRIYMMLSDIMAADIHNIARFENPVEIIAKFTYLENGKFSRREIKVFLQSLQTIYGENCITLKNI